MSSIGEYRTGSGQPRWRVRFRTPDGRQTDKRGFLSKAAAQDWIDRMQVAEERVTDAAAHTQELLDEAGRLAAAHPNAFDLELLFQLAKYLRTRKETGVQ